MTLLQRCLCAAFAPHTSTRGPSGLVSSLLAAGYDDGTLRVFDVNKAEMIMKIQPHRCSARAIVYGNGGFDNG